MFWPYMLAAPVVAISGFVIAPTAAADCTTSGNTTICSLGDGSNSGSGPTMPYPCRYDYYCNDQYGWEFDIDLDSDPGPGIGAPGRPGDRPGGGGGGNRPGGGGRR